ncbi:MAG: PAS domain-containing protein [Mobilibacterium timonense]|uniref:PAS domain-containing protein n=1 Tax=Mobilibacterium timonense TaxID=1871012 RepID=UPI002357CAC9|nr:PAS domain-containing protein [Mobilibacterium timonense]MBM6990219.1 PAS domain-containing protein [Mobilibacterium timonense]
MNREQLFDTLISTACGLHKMMGNNTEVVLHDLVNRRILYIANGKITGRDKNYKISESTYKTIINMADEDGHLVGDSVRSVAGDLRTSHFIYYDGDVPVALLCINQDVSKLEESIYYLESLLKINNSNEQSSSGLGDNHILRMAKQIIIDSMDKLHSGEVNTREGKLKLLTILYNDGIFEIRDSANLVCGALGISRTSLYNYLRELKKQGVITEKQTLIL